MKYKQIWLFIIMWVIFPILPISAQEKTETIEIIDAGSLQSGKRNGLDVRRFLDHVVFKHNEATMYCDSAYIISGQNIMHAFSNVHITRGDSLHMYGDYLKYNGDTYEGKVRRNVKLTDEKVILTTDSLNFNTETNIAYYFTGGKTVNEDNILTSLLGYYYSDIKTFFFKDTVVLTTPDYTVYTDTLKYLTQIEKAIFLGPTDIVNEESTGYCERGWYNTNLQQFQFNQNAIYQSKEHIFKGDSVFFDDSLGIGRARLNIEMFDTINNTILRGNYLDYTREPEMAFVTDSALLIQVTDNLDSLFLHADILHSSTLEDSSRILKAYHHVKIFKSDMQGKCDSLVYTFSDSVISLHIDPVVWASGSQITADLIKIFVKGENDVEKFELHKSAFIVNQEDTISFNQIKGKKMIGHLSNNRLKRVDVFGNGQSIYYTKDEDETEILGMNYAESTDMIIYMRNNNVSRLNMVKKPKGTLFPIDEAQDRILKGFIWREAERPKSRNDIFFWEAKQAEFVIKNTEEETVEEEITEEDKDSKKTTRESRRARKKK